MTKISSSPIFSFMHKNERKFIMKLRVVKGASTFKHNYSIGQRHRTQLMGFSRLYKKYPCPRILCEGESLTQIKSNQIQPNQNKSNQINSNQIQPNQSKSNQFKLVKRPWIFLSGWRRSCQFFSPNISINDTTLSHS